MFRINSHTLSFQKTLTDSVLGEGARPTAMSIRTLFSSSPRFSVRVCWCTCIVHRATSLLAVGERAAQKMGRGGGKDGT